MIWMLTGAISLICVALAFIPAHLASWISRAFEWSGDEIELRLIEMEGR